MSTDIKAAQDAVHNFMVCAGQGTNVTPMIPPLVTTHRRYDMLLEEVMEFMQAVRDNDLTEIADAIADIIYVALGAAVEAGIDIEPVLEEVIRSNDTKIDWANARPWKVKPSGKIAKDENYEPPLLGPILERQGHIPGEAMTS